jgi:DNA-binding LacI/PurR family transcriptional regulator
MAKRVTTKEIARLAGVSRTTVSFVLNNIAGAKIADETRQRILEIAERLDYHPDATARRMVSGKTNVIGIVVRQSIDQAFVDHFLPEVLHGLSQSSVALGYHVLFEAIPSDVTNGAYTKLIRERHVDGIILSGPRVDDAELLRIHAEGVPIVLLGQFPHTDMSFVDVDNVDGAERATRHLIELGHRRIGIITNASLIYTASADRLAGYRQALANAGIAFDETLVREGDFSPHGGELQMQALLALDQRPTAVFVASDTVALGALQAIRAHGLHVPNEIAIVGFDDIYLSEFIDPPLTTIRLPAFALGWNAAEMLIQHIAEGVPANPTRILLQTELVVRRSSGDKLSATAATR